MKKQIIMPWKETTTMEQKVEFICEWLCKLSPLTNITAQ